MTGTQTRPRASAVITSTLLGLFLSMAMAAPATAQEEEPKIDAYSVLQQANQDAAKRRYNDAIEKYYTAIKADPNNLPNAYYNLGEVLRFKNKFTMAALAYGRFLELQPDVKDRPQIEKTISECQNEVGRLGKITIKVEGPAQPLIFINNLPVSSKADTPLTLPAGKYSLLVKADDFHTFAGTVEVLEGDDRDVFAKLKAKTYFGWVTITVNVDGAEVSIDGESKGMTPLKKPIKLTAGKRFLEVKKDGYHRWIRNLYINRDDKQTLDITNMQRLSQ